ncbi:MAG: adenylate/guanylate cyclase domain-containing protein [Planctomycetota bacterium]
MGQHEFSLDETELEDDSKAEMEGRGTIFRTLPAMPPEPAEGTAPMPVTPKSEALLSSAIHGLGSEMKEDARKESLEERKLRLIRSVGEAVIDVIELSTVAHEILHILVDELQPDRGFLCLFSENNDRGLPIASYGLAPDEPVTFSRTVCREMLQNRAGVLIEKGDDNAAVSASLAAMEIFSTICVPLWTKDRIMGFMSMDITSSARSFTTRDLELLISVSHQAAIGVERARLEEVAIKERKRRDYLCQYLDHKIIHSVLNSQEEEDPLAPHLQEVTTMFCDIASFTKMSEGLAATELAAFVQEHFTAMTEILFSHNGTVDKYIGDAVMALFGAPVLDPKAAEYAVRAAVEMRKHAQGSSDPRIRLRFGIATGQAVVGNIGSSQRREYTAIGDPVNVAARLESFARPGEIVVDEATARGLDDEFELTDIGDIDVRNRQEPVRVYQVEPR